MHPKVLHRYEISMGLDYPSELHCNVIIMLKDTRINIWPGSKIFMSDSEHTMALKTNYLKRKGC